MLEGLGLAPPSAVPLGLFDEKDFAVLPTNFLATTVASDHNGRRRAFTDAQQKRCERPFMASISVHWA